MALKDTVTADEFKGLEEGLRGLYIEKDGGYRLDIEGREDVSGLKSALEKERAAVKTSKEQIKAWEALGASPEEISALLKSQAKKEPPKEPDNPAKEQLEEMRKLMAELRDKQSRTDAELRSERIEKQFMDYPEAQRALLVGLVKGTTAEEVSESVKALKEAFPIQPQGKPSGGVGGPSNPPSRKEADDAAAEYGKKRAQAQSKNTNQEAFKTI